MLLGRAQGGRRSLENLVRLVADEDDRHALISKVASDKRLIRDALRTFKQLNESPGRPSGNLVRLCSLYQVDLDYFAERVCLIVHILNLNGNKEDFYQVLGVGEKCSQDDIKRAFRHLSLLYHPDRNGSDRHACSKFLQIARAYEVLGSPAFRAEYDRRTRGPAWVEARSSAESGKDGLNHFWVFFSMVALMLAVIMALDYRQFHLTNQIKPTPGEAAPELKANAIGIGLGRVGGEHDLFGAFQVTLIPRPSLSTSSDAQARLSQGDHGEETSCDTGYDPFEQDHLESGSSDRTSRFPWTLEDFADRAQPDGIEARLISQGRLFRAIRTQDGMQGMQKEKVAKVRNEAIQGQTAGADQPSGAAGILQSPKHEHSSSAGLKPENRGEEHSLPQDMERKIERFLNRYIQAYERKDLSGFLGLFEPDAIENGERVRNLSSVYMETFQQTEWIHYRIRVLGWSTIGRIIQVDGSARLFIQRPGEPSKEFKGSIRFGLVRSGEDLRVRSLHYRFE